MENEELLQKAIEDSCEQLESIEPGSEQQAIVTDNLTKLLKAKFEAERNSDARKDAKKERIISCVTTGVKIAGTVALTLLLTAIEREGPVTFTGLRNMLTGKTRL